MEITSLYGGEVRLEFDPEKHKYWVVIDGKRNKVPSVTSITGIVDKSRPLMIWAVKTALESVKSAVQPNRTYTEHELKGILNAATQYPQSVKQEAADIGTMAHAWLERYFKGENPEMPSENMACRPCIDASLNWLAVHNVKFLHNERPIYSKRFKYSGRLDGIALVDGAKTLIDWKTGNGIYSEAVLQTGAYSAAYTEETGEEVEQRWIVRLAKETGRFHSKVYPSKCLSKDYKAFLAAMRLQARLKAIEKEDRSRQRDWIEELAA